MRLVKRILYVWMNVSLNVQSTERFNVSVNEETLIVKKSTLKFV